MRVLIVDDDPDFRRLLAMVLEGRGHEVVTIGSAFGLLNRVSGWGEAGQAIPRPDVLVLDHMLPGLPGGEALLLLAKGTRTREVPVMLVSASGEAFALEELSHRHPNCLFVPKTGKIKAMADKVEGMHARAAGRVEEGV